MCIITADCVPMFQLHYAQQTLGRTNNHSTYSIVLHIQIYVQALSHAQTQTLLYTTKLSPYPHERLSQQKAQCARASKSKVLCEFCGVFI